MSRPDIGKLPGAVVISVGHVNLDMASIVAIRERAELALDRRDFVILDLRGVEFVDTIGLGFICSWMKKAEAGSFVVAGVGPRLDVSLRRLPPGRRPTMFDTVEDARQLAAPIDDLEAPKTIRISTPSDPHPPQYKTNHA